MLSFCCRPVATRGTYALVLVIAILRTGRGVAASRAERLEPTTWKVAAANHPRRPESRDREQFGLRSFWDGVHAADLRHQGLRSTHQTDRHTHRADPDGLATLRLRMNAACGRLRAPGHRCADHRPPKTSRPLRTRARVQQLGRSLNSARRLSPASTGLRPPSRVSPRRYKTQWPGGWRGGAPCPATMSPR
jgi:hypothetical protein